MNICGDYKRFMDCSWEREFKPVEGWTARPEKHTYKENGVTIEVDTFDIIDCPLFIPPKHRYTKRKSFQDKEAYRKQFKAGKMVKGQSLSTGETKVWEKISFVSNDGFIQGKVSECASGKRKQHKGWRFWFVRASTVEKENRNDAKGEVE